MKFTENKGKKLRKRMPSDTTMPVSRVIRKQLRNRVLTKQLKGLKADYNSELTYLLNLAAKSEGFK